MKTLKPDREYCSEIKETIKWIGSGKIGCSFASTLVKIHQKIGWHFIVLHSTKAININFELLSTKAKMVTIVFPGANMELVRQWALRNKMYVEIIHDTEVHSDGSNNVYEGLRLNIHGKVSWVQYFGPDSHVKTRQAPYSMLTLSLHPGSHVYFKTMISGILHVAHASIEFLSEKAANILWKQSFIKTKKELGKSPGLAEAAKVTFVLHESKNQ